MLKLMRSSKFFTVFLLGAISIMITVVFVFWGIGPQQSTSDVVVAQIDNMRITSAEYDRSYQLAYRRARETYKDEEMIKNLNLRTRVLDDLIGRRVLRIAAENAGLIVTEDELRKAIMREPAFQKDGVFNKEVYTRRLRLNRMTPSIFENELKNDILINKIHRLIGETAELTDEDAKVLELIKGSNAQLVNTFLSSKMELAVAAYVEGLKRQMDISINKDYISY
jgi:peptidyl-prolyl cis-trans isomerase D